MVSPARMRSPAQPWPLAGAACASCCAIARPRQREPVVEDAARPQRAAARIGDHRQRRDRGEVRRPHRRGEELRDARVRDADHADLAVRDPRLRGDRFDDVVAVGPLQRLEELERAARTAGAADVDADGCEPERGRDQRARLRRVRVRRRVPGVLDDGRVRTLVGRARQRDVHRQQGAVTRLEISVPGADRLGRRRTTPAAPSFGPVTVERRADRAGRHRCRSTAATRKPLPSRTSRKIRLPWASAVPFVISRSCSSMSSSCCPGCAPVIHTWSTLPCAANAAGRSATRRRAAPDDRRDRRSPWPRAVQRARRQPTGRPRCAP